jgi:hypothetical protein
VVSLRTCIGDSDSGTFEIFAETLVMLCKSSELQFGHGLSGERGRESQPFSELSHVATMRTNFWGRESIVKGSEWLEVARRGGSQSNDGDCAGAVWWWLSVGCKLVGWEDLRYITQT